MPYAGTRDGGAGIFNSYAQGAQLKMMRRQAAMEEKQRALTMKLAEAANARAERLAVDNRQQDEVKNYFETQRLGIAQRGDERAQEDQAAQNADRERTIKARNDAATATRAAADQQAQELLAQNPKLKQHYDVASEFAKSPEFQKLEPEAKALFIGKTGEGAKAIVAEGDKERAGRVVNKYLRGAYGSIGGQPNEALVAHATELSKALANGAIDGRTAMTTMAQLHKEAKDDFDDATFRAQESPNMLQTYMPLAKTAEQRQALIGIVNGFATPGGPQHKDAEASIMDVLNPKQSKTDPRMQARWSAQEKMLATDPSLDPAQAKATLDALYGPEDAAQAQPQGGGGGQGIDVNAAAAYLRDHPKATREEVAAAVGGGGGGFDIGASELDTPASEQPAQPKAANFPGFQLKRQTPVGTGTKTLEPKKAVAAPAEDFTDTHDLWGRKVPSKKAAADADAKAGKERDAAISGIRSVSNALTHAEQEELAKVYNRGSTEDIKAFVAKMKAKYGG